MKYIDLHCDTLTELKEGETLVRNHKNVDLKSLKKGGCVIQCASIFIPTGTYTGVDRKEADRKSTRLNSSHSRKSRMPSSA